MECDLENGFVIRIFISESGRPRGASENNLERESWSGSKLDVRPDDEIPWPRSDDDQTWYASLLDGPQQKL